MTPRRRIVGRSPAQAGERSKKETRLYLEHEQDEREVELELELWWHRAHRMMLPTEEEVQGRNHPTNKEGEIDDQDSMVREVEFSCIQ